ncbi:hypothetical protein DFH06DRAFT_1348996 [Mycena polygramma]|nr:hypothetical protein DFH06DRAFT_1348996 [Mycena polygramma]
MATSLDSTVAENQCRDLVLWKTPNIAIPAARRARYLANCLDLQRSERNHNLPFPVKFKFPVFCPACPVISYDIGCGFSRGPTNGEGVEATWVLLNPYMGGKQMAAGSRHTDGEELERAWLRPARTTWRAKL